MNATRLFLFLLFAAACLPGARLVALRPSPLEGAGAASRVFGTAGSTCVQPPRSRGIDTEPPGESPDIAVIDDLALHYGPVVFDHGLHVSMSEIAGECGNCHHETAAGEPITGCGSCHPLSRSCDDLRISLKGAFHRQCLDCHRDWSHANSCGFCHEEAGGAPRGDLYDPGEFIDAPPAHISPQPTYTYLTEREPLAVVTFHHEDHAEVFGLTCADCHREDSCDRCHGAGGARQVVTREESCTPCHSASACTDCHGAAERARFDHAAAAGWELGDGHEGAECAACHGRGSDASVADPSALRCRACHEAAHGGGLDPLAPEVPLLGSHGFHECTSCHAVSGVAQRASCAGCHEGMSYPERLPGLPVGAGEGAGNVEVPRDGGEPARSPRSGRHGRGAKWLPGGGGG